MGRSTERVMGSRIEITACSYKLLPLQALEGSAGRIAGRNIQPKIDTSMKFISLHVQLQLWLCQCVYECVVELRLPIAGLEGRF